MKIGGNCKNDCRLNICVDLLKNIPQKLHVVSEVVKHVVKPLF